MEALKHIGILKSLFWDYRWDSVKEHLTSPFVIARVLEMGNPEQVQVFLQMVGKQTIRDFLSTHGKKLLSNKSYNFWTLYYAQQKTD